VLKDDVNKKLKIFATCVSAGLLVILHYVVLQVQGELNRYGSEMILNGISNPIQLIGLFTSLVGTNIVHNYDFMFFTGGFILLLLFSVIWTNKHSLDFNETAVWYSLMIYGCVTMVALVFLRLRIMMMPSMRHFSSTLFLLVGLLPLAYYYFSRTGKIQVQMEQLQTSRDIQLTLLAMISCVMILSAAFHLLPGIDVGYGWLHAQSNRIDVLYGHTIDDTKWNGFSRDYSIFMMARDGAAGSWHYYNLAVIDSHIKYFKENQLNLYDPSQNIHFNGIWNNIREFVHYQKNWQRVFLDWIIPVRYTEHGEIVSITYDVYEPPW
jgi:hypothetical protein